MDYNPNINQDKLNAKMYFEHLCNGEKLFKIETIEQIRTETQSGSRWLYLQMVVRILNEQGHTYNPPNTKIEVKFTKDLLYQVYWNTMRLHMYPNKEGQLTTKEFCELVEMVQMLFAKVFDIHIEFPNINYFLDKLNDRA